MAAVRSHVVAKGFEEVESGVDIVVDIVVELEMEQRLLIPAHV